MYHRNPRSTFYLTECHIPPPDAPAGSSVSSGNAASRNNADGEADVKPTVQVPWGICPKEVPKEAKRHRQNNVLPSAIEKRNHYDQRFNKVDDYRSHMTAVAEAVEHATQLIKDAKAISSPIANDIACLLANHLATVFTMVLKAGLQGFVPDIEGPVQSAYNQLHRHITVSAFQFLSSSFPLMALNINNQVAQDHNLLSDMILRRQNDVGFCGHARFGRANTTWFESFPTSVKVVSGVIVLVFGQVVREGILKRTLCLHLGTRETAYTPTLYAQSMEHMSSDIVRWAKEATPTV
ncbi:hypothetical protein C8R43DRAFT_948463 [Mycena crocata]|nr:hypothetical protein C8R43DRAFT_948463 [Mycena crocata]